MSGCAALGSKNQSPETMVDPSTMAVRGGWGVYSGGGFRPGGSSAGILVRTGQLLSCGLT